MDPVGIALSILDAHLWTLWGLFMGASFGAMWGFRDAAAAHADHQNTLRHMATLIGHLQATIEVLEENDLAEEAANRGNRYATENLVEMDHAQATTPSLLDRLRDRLTFSDG